MIGAVLIPVPWVESRGRNAMWHITPKAQPGWGPQPTMCGKTVDAINVVWEGEKPPTNDYYTCAKCVAKISDRTVTEVLTEAIKAHAIANYTAGGWDVIVECWDDEQIAKVIGRTTTFAGAYGKVKSVVSVYADYQADAINSAF
jgi:hypothetical protein